MPAPIIKGLIDVAANSATGLNCYVWDGETPRYDPLGNPIVPGSTATPPNWPSLRLGMTEAGFRRKWTTEDAYEDSGEIIIQVWDTGRKLVDDRLNTLEKLFAQAATWASVQLPGGGGVPPNSNPYYIIQMLLTSWSCIQVRSSDANRTALSELVYLGTMVYQVDIHGAISTA